MGAPYITEMVKKEEARLRDLATGTWFYISENGLCERDGCDRLLDSAWVGLARGPAYTINHCNQSFEEVFHSRNFLKTKEGQKYEIYAVELKEVSFTSCSEPLIRT